MLYGLPGKMCGAVPYPLRKPGMKDPFFWCIHKRVAEAKSVSHIPCDIIFINGMIFLARG
jgi:hypothetical protein